MPEAPNPRQFDSSLSFRIGRWAEARATGWGIAALMVLALLLMAVALSGRLLLLQ